jgi:hypothetical protein
MMIPPRDILFLIFQFWFICTVRSAVMCQNQNYADYKIKDKYNHPTVLSPKSSFYFETAVSFYFRLL